MGELGVAGPHPPFASPTPCLHPPPQDLAHLRSLIQRHVKHTASAVGRAILLDWDAQHRHFVKARGRPRRRAARLRAS